MIIRIPLHIPTNMKQFPIVTNLIIVIREQVSIAFGTIRDWDAAAVGTVEGEGVSGAFVVFGGVGES